MLQISSKPPKKTILILFTKASLNILPFFDIEEKKTIQNKLNDGMQIISFNKTQKNYFLVPIEIDVTKKEDSVNEKFRILGNSIFKTLKENKETC